MTMHPVPTAELDSRFSDPAAGPTPWSEAARVLEQAELYWLTTVRADGRPHVTPLIGVVEDGAVHFCTGLREQKARNLEHRTQVALTTGNNSWAQGLDVVVEGRAARVTDHDTLQRLADAFEAKYGSVWHFDVGDGGFGEGEEAAPVFRIEPTKALAFAKQPHAQTRYRFGQPSRSAIIPPVTPR
jgi:nitroimidazol reductase NimA-like FMN-containing flavoprotein (pyridoxamine 5'-phosphate oxidase superfamily)